MSEGVAASDEQAPVETADRWVGTLELFFDLVFVYAMSQVTILMLADISWAGFGCGLLTLAALIPVAVFGPALTALAGLTLVCLFQTGWELWRHPAIGPVDSA